MARTIAKGRVRRSALDHAYDVALQDAPAELRPLVLQLADNMREGQRIRDELGTAKIRTGTDWFDINDASCRLARV
jgi:hypothetical protein